MIARSPQPTIHFLASDWPETVDDAAQWLSGWLRPFVPGDGVARVSGRALERAVRAGVLPRGAPGSVTHVVRFGCARDARFVRAVASFRVGPRDRCERWGAELLLTLASLDEVADPFRAAVGMDRTTGAWAGFTSDLTEQVNALSFRMHAPPGELPLGASCVALGRGFLLRSIQSFEDADAVSRSVKALAASLRGGPLPATVAPRVDLSAAPLMPAPALATPSPIEPPPRVMSPPINPDETVPLGVRVPLGVVLPFSGTTGEETLAALARRPDEGPNVPAASADETVMLPPGGAGSRTSPVPFLTLQQYADLRAHLTVFGEHHEPTWASFGLTSPASRELTKARFAALFAYNEEMRARFLELLPVAIAALKNRPRTPQ